MKKTISALAVSALWLLSPVAAASLEWKLNNNFAETRTETKLLKGYAAEITAKSDGKLKVTAYNGGALGLKDADALRWLTSGAADLGLVVSTYLGRDSPELNAAYIQGVVQSREDHLKALPVLKQVYAEFLEKWNLVPLAYMRVPIWKMSLFCRNEPINTIAQLRTKKLRVYSKDLVETFSALGVSAQIIPQNEMYVALQTGVVDCTIYGNQLAHTVSLQEVTKQSSYLFPAATMPFVVSISKSKWDTLPDDLKKVVREASERLEQESAKTEWDPAAEDTAVAKLKSAGVNILPDFSSDDQAAFAAAARKTWQQVADQAGPKAVDWRSRILKTMDAK
ncbi:C4-dicarboxylate ABC transporter substrate-binding protein [Hyphomicrobiales bacterium]|nr:C4-dicarboxylate ABC transporter substrate-binding protein [Hyphomicrobiales bacterium]CAH1671597.1 C4-dicarboxylate ABC transporter substrate-binding protein [Hyphomicrobiales bacterium]